MLPYVLLKKIFLTQIHLWIKPKVIERVIERVSDSKPRFHLELYAFEPEIIFEWDAWQHIYTTKNIWSSLFLLLKALSFHSRASIRARKHIFWYLKWLNCWKSRGETLFNETAFLFWCHALWKLGSSNCCIFEMKHASGLETCTKIYFLFFFNLPWIPEVFLACVGNFRCWPNFGRRPKPRVAKLFALLLLYPY